MGSERASKLEGCHLACGLDKFRHRARQFAHVVNDQRRSVLSQTSPVLRAAMASTGEADRGHAGFSSCALPRDCATPPRLTLA
jgi:hypothetical protein